jgi:hypothetical protein
MKKLIQGMIASLVCFGTGQADTFTHKTFLMPRSHNENMAMEYTGFHKQYRPIDSHKWGSSIQATGFYQESTNKTELGEYFGKHNTATGPNTTNPYSGKIQDFIWVTDRQAMASSPLNNEKALLLEAHDIIHDFKNLVTSHMDSKGTLRPKQTSYGVRFDYYQKLDKLAEGLYFKVAVPVVHIENDMHVCYTGTQQNQKQPWAISDSGKTVSLEDYLEGEYHLTGTQAPLTHAKINGTQSKTTVADVKVTLGYNFLYKEDKHWGVSINMSIPTTDTPKGNYLFEPAAGFGGHWAFGMGLDCACRLWTGKHDKNLEFVGAIDYSFVLKETEKRTLDFKYSDSTQSALHVDAYQIAGKRVPMGYYMLGGQYGHKGTFPLANVLTRDVSVEPGSRVEALANFTFNCRKWTIDFGYNFFAKEHEAVSVKHWVDNTYAIAKWNYDPMGNFGDSDTFLSTLYTSAYPGYIQEEDLLAEDAATPLMVTHKLYMGINYTLGVHKYPVLLGLGGSWEFIGNGNCGLNGYALWAKAGITF